MPNNKYYSSGFLKHKILGISILELSVFFLFYVFSAVGYYTTIWITNKALNLPNEYWDLSGFVSTSGFDYMIKMIFTIPIWFLIFRVFKHLSLSKKLILHLILLPFFVVATKWIYYEISKQVGWGRLSGFAEIWDYYIPTLFYILQFSFFHAYHYYHQNKQQLLLAAELRESTLKSELSALKAQLNPHFLFNVFNTINASIPNDQEHTRTLIAKLSDLFRYQTRISRMDVVPLKEEIGFIENYLSLEKSRFGKRLTITIDIEKGVETKLVPPMLLQPLVENAIKHGISDLIEGGEIIIKVYQEDEYIHFNVADTGKGIKDKSQVFGKGIGLTNTKLRLEKRYQSKLVIVDNEPKGILIKFSIKA
ncbi:sensor histidine kinase [Flavobacteriaceae bacterium R38]|nr:sensor histidine kinase [Flavobacteriaceae bacterium R38]